MYSPRSVKQGCRPFAPRSVQSRTALLSAEEHPLQRFVPDGADRQGETHQELMTHRAKSRSQHSKNHMDKTTHYQPCLTPGPHLGSPQRQHVFFAPSLKAEKPFQNLHIEFSSHASNLLGQARGSQNPFFSWSRSCRRFHGLTCLPRFVRNLEAGKPSNTQVERFHSFFQRFQTPHLSPGTWEDFALVLQSHDPACRVAGTSLYFHSIGPRMRRVDSYLTVGTSPDPRQGSLIDHLLPADSTVLPLSLLHSRPFALLKTRCPRGFHQGSSVSFPGFASIAKSFVRLKTFVLCNLHVFPHLFHETRCLMFLFFPFKKSFELVTNLIPFPCFFLSSVAALWNVVHKSASLFALSLRFLFFVMFVSFTSELSVSYSAKTFLHFLFGLACSLASTELCPPLLPAGFSWCHTTLCFSTYHFSLSWPSSEPWLSSLHWTVFSSCGMSKKTTGTPLCIAPKLKRTTASNPSFQLFVYSTLSYVCAV